MPVDESGQAQGPVSTVTMKAWKLEIVVVLCVTVLLPAGRSVESPITKNPAGYGTIPQSNLRSGLANTPNPIDPTGNLLMTGNVRRGMHFRGSVPYRSTTSFNASLGSSALNSFLRDTAGSEDFIDRSNKYRVQPFYSPTQTVTTMAPGRSEIFRPMGMRINGRSRDGSLWPSGSGDKTILGDRRDGPPWPSGSDDKTITRDGNGQAQGPVPTVLVPGQLGIRQARDIRSDPSRQRSDAAGQYRDRDADRGMLDLAIDSRQDSESGLVGKEELKIENEEFRIPNSKFESPQTDSRHIDSNERHEVLDDIRRKLEALTKSVEAGLQKEDGNKELRMENGEWRIPNSKLDISEEGRIRQGASSASDGSQTSRYSMLDARYSTKIKNPESSIEQENEEWMIPNSKLESLESFSQSRFNKHISTAENHLKAGRYYQAVDSFTLAAIYQPNNPIVLKGKSHALFAAGEYMSSALFLSRALAIRGEYTQTKVDFEALLGDSDKLAERITDVESAMGAAGRSGSAQLQFLLGYVYFHTGKLNQARQAIAKAEEKMPESSAVIALRTAINQAAK